MQKKKIYFVIISFFTFLLVVSCETKSEIRTANEIKSIRANVADSILMIENVKDEVQLIKGELEKQSFKQENSLDLEAKILDIEKKQDEFQENFNKILDDLKLNIEKEINSIKEDFTKAIENLKKTLSSNDIKKTDISKLDIDTRYKKGLSLYNNKKYDEAINYFNTIVGSKSRWYDERARFYSGNINFHLSKFEEAIVIMHDFSTKYPKSIFLSKAFLVQAESFLKLNMKDEAKSTYNEIILKFPDTNEAKIAKRKINNL
jgi:TolA-binding protein